MQSWANAWTSFQTVDQNMKAAREHQCPDNRRLPARTAPGKTTAVLTARGAFSIYFGA
jgi:hypothetical protein